MKRFKNSYWFPYLIFQGAIFGEVLFSFTLKYVGQLGGHNDALRSLHYSFYFGAFFTLSFIYAALYFGGRYARNTAFKKYHKSHTMQEVIRDLYHNHVGFMQLFFWAVVYQTLHFLALRGFPEFGIVGVHYAFSYPLWFVISGSFALYASSKCEEIDEPVYPAKLVIFALLFIIVGYIGYDDYLAYDYEGNQMSSSFWLYLIPLVLFVGNAYCEFRFSYKLKRLSKKNSHRSQFVRNARAVIAKKIAIPLALITIALVIATIIFIRARALQTFSLELHPQVKALSFNALVVIGGGLLFCLYQSMQYLAFKERPAEKEGDKPIPGVNYTFSYPYWLCIGSVLTLFISYFFSQWGEPITMKKVVTTPIYIGLVGLMAYLDYRYYKAKEA